MSPAEKASAEKETERALQTLTEISSNRAEFMPKDYSISLERYYRGGTDRFLLNPPTQRTQRMKGFDEKYVDIIDWIIRITHAIWEEGGVGRIYDFYRHNSVVHYDAGVRTGREVVVADTIATISAFPDFRGYAEDVIWAGNDEVGFHTSHRAMLQGYNTGYSQFGPPTGKRVTYWVIANCVSLENEIYEEWVLYNTGAMLKQLGFNVLEKARELAPKADLSGLRDRRFGEPDRLPGLGKPPVMPPKSSPGFDIEDFIRRAYHEVWNWRLLNQLYTYYAPNIRLHGPTDREFYGVGAVKAFIMSIMTMFPDLALQIDDIYWMGNDREGYRTSVRWSLLGTHRGPGIYGEPTGKQISMWGLTQHVVKDGKIQEEWTLFNEFVVLQQILGFA